MSPRDFLELRRALERLRDALAEAMRALEGAEEGVAASGDYAAHGAPFGPEPGAERLWELFRQYTTKN